MNYNDLGQQILGLVGGAGNIDSFTNCMTRLRLNLVDSSLADVDAIKALDGVLGVVDGQQLQVVVGPGHAQRLRDAFGDELGRAPAPELDVAAAAAEDLARVSQQTKEKVKAKQSTSVHAGFRHIGNIFIPIIPGFIACGIIASIANIWKVINPAIAANPWFLAFAGIGSVLIAGLQFIVGHNTAKEFGGTPVLGFIAGGIPYMPALAGIAATETAAAQPLVIPLFGQLSPALGGVIGAMATAWLFTVIEKQLRKIVPAALELFIIPAVTVIIGAAASILVLMPISALLMRGLTWLLVDFGLQQGGVVGGFLMASLFLPMVMLGIHQGLTPLHTQLIADYGFTQLLPILAMAGAGQDGMAIAVWLKTKNAKLRKIIEGALPLGLLGIGEPLIYGVSLPLFYPFITACLGAGFGGAFVSFGMQVSGPFGAQALGLSGFMMTGVITPGMWGWYVGGILIGALAGFLLTYFFGFKRSMESRLD